MSFEVYAESVESGLRKTKQKLIEIEQAINNGALKGDIDKSIISKIGKFQGEFEYYTQKELDSLIEYCEEHEEPSMDIQQMIQAYQLELDGYEKAYNKLLASRPKEEIQNLHNTVMRLGEEAKRKKAG